MPLRLNVGASQKVSDERYGSRGASVNLDVELDSALVMDPAKLQERVRQLFVAGCIQSAYWHRFSATAHSPIGLAPHEYGITLKPPANITFAHNDLAFDDPTGTDHVYLGAGLRKALYNFMHGVGLDTDVREWFEPRTAGGNGSGKRGGRRVARRVPRTTVPADLIERSLD